MFWEVLNVLKKVVASTTKPSLLNVTGLILYFSLMKALPHLPLSLQVALNFFNNTTGDGGAAIYATDISRCTYTLSQLGPNENEFKNSIFALSQFNYRYGVNELLMHYACQLFPWNPRLFFCSFGNNGCQLYPMHWLIHGNLNTTYLAKSWKIISQSMSNTSQRNGLSNSRFDKCTYICVQWLED